MDKYIELAVSKGAEHAVLIKPDDVVFDGRAILKCMFGCRDWGKGCTCPSRLGFFKPWEFEKLLRMYKSVLIIHSRVKEVAQKASFAVERQAYFDGDVLAFSMSDCALCTDCAGRSGQECRNVMEARPAFQAAGIDVFSTVKKLGLPIKTLREPDEEQNWYAAVWLN